MRQCRASYLDARTFEICHSDMCVIDERYALFCIDYLIPRSISN